MVTSFRPPGPLPGQAPAAVPPHAFVDGRTPQCRFVCAGARPVTRSGDFRASDNARTVGGETAVEGSGPWPVT